MLHHASLWLECWVMLGIRRGVPHWTAVCCAGVSIRCPPWCPRSGLYSTLPLSGPNLGGLFHCMAWETKKGIKERRNELGTSSGRSVKKKTLQKELTPHCRSFNRNAAYASGSLNLVMDMHSDSICWGKWVIQHDGKRRWVSTRLPTGYKREHR